MRARSIAFSPLRSGQIPATATLLADALDRDPAYRFLLPSETSRRAGLRELFARNLETHLPHRCSYVLTDAEDVVATVTVRPPGGVPTSALTMIRRGLIPFAVRHDYSAVQRLLALKRTYDALEHDLGRGAPHLHVHMMAVKSGLQGQGLGSLLLDQALGAARPEPSAPEVPIVLTTHTAHNVRFYEKRGFAVVSEQDVRPGGGEAYPVWGMSRSLDRVATPT